MFNKLKINELESDNTTCCQDCTCCSNCDCTTCECDNTCDVCENADEYIVSISRDTHDTTILKSVSNTGKITSWEESDIKNITLAGGEIVINKTKGGVTTINGGDLDFEYLQSIDRRLNGSFDITDSYGKITNIPDGFPTGVRYANHNFTLTTKDGQEITVDVLDALGSYVKCVKKNCQGDYEFEIVSNGSCNSCDNTCITIPGNISGEEVDPFYNADKPLIALNSTVEDEVVSLNNGDGTTIDTYSKQYLDTNIGGKTTSNITTADSRFTMTMNEGSYVTVASKLATGAITGKNKWLRVSGSVWINQYDLDSESDIDNFMMYLPNTLVSNFLNTQFKLKYSHTEYSKYDSQAYYVCDIEIDKNILYDISSLFGELKFDLFYMGDDLDKDVHIESHIIIEEYDDIKVWNGGLENKFLN